MNIPLGELQNLWGDRFPKIDGSKHAAIFGATGSGKSTLLLNIIVEHIRAGHGVCVIDPHGELVDRIAPFIPKARLRDTVWFDPTAQNVIGLNPLAGDNKIARLQQTLNIVSTIWRDAWGPQSDFIARNFGEAIVEVEPKPTLLHIYKAFMVPSYRDSLFSRVRSENLRLFYAKFSEEWDARQQAQAAAPPTNKLDSFLQPHIRHVIGQADGLPIGRMMDEGKIILCRFSKGQLGPDAGAFLASILVSQILFAALEREKQSYYERRFFGVFIDEFHNLTRGNSQEHLLSETRKYGIALTLADQTIDQLPEGSEAGIFGNVSSLIIGRVGARDSERLSKELGLQEARALLTLPAYHWYLKVVNRGAVSDPLLIRGLEPPTKRGDETTLDSVIRWSSQNFGSDWAKIDRELNRFLKGEPNEPARR